MVVKDLRQSVQQLSELRARKEQLEKRIQRVQERIIRHMAKQDQEAVECPADDGLLFRATLVQPTRTNWDVEVLKSSVVPRVFKQVTRTVVDNSAVEEAIKTGVVPVDVVASACEVVETRPYVRVTLVKAVERGSSS